MDAPQAPRADFEAEGPMEPGESATRKRRRRRRRRGKGGAGEGTESLGLEAGLPNLTGDASEEGDQEAPDQAPVDAIPATDAVLPVEAEALAPVAPPVERKRRERTAAPKKALAPAPIPDEAPSSQADAEPDGAEGTEGEAGGHKRRRRRRRGKGGAGDAGGPLEGAGDDAGHRGTGASRPDEELPESQAASDAGDPAPAEATAEGDANPKKRPRHRGGRGRKKADGTGSGSDAAPDESPAPGPDAVPED